MSITCCECNSYGNRAGSVCLMKSILIINEDIDETNEIKSLLEDAQSKVICASNIQEALNCFVRFDFNLVILTAELSADDDHKLLRAMRKAKTTPILVLSSKSDHSERLTSLQAGAHAYMDQPYTLEECLAQAQSLMQMYVELHPDKQECFTLVRGEDLVIDPECRQVFLNGKELHLTRIEFDLLFCLASNPGKVFSRSQLYDLVWNEYAAFNVDDVVKAHIKALHQKLSETNKEYIINVWGVGYRFHDEK